MTGEFWIAAIRRHFQSAENSAHSKSPPLQDLVSGFREGIADVRLERSYKQRMIEIDKIQLMPRAEVKL